MTPTWDLALFQPGEGPALRHDVTDGCAFESHGRFLARRCHEVDTSHEVVDPTGTVLEVCAPHADAWCRTAAVLDGIDVVRERTR